MDRASRASGDGTRLHGVGAAICLRSRLQPGLAIGGGSACACGLASAQPRHLAAGRRRPSGSNPSERFFTGAPRWPAHALWTEMRAPIWRAQCGRGGRQSSQRMDEGAGLPPASISSAVTLLELAHDWCSRRRPRQSGPAFLKAKAPSLHVLRTNQIPAGWAITAFGPHTDLLVSCRRRGLA